MTKKIMLCNYDIQSAAARLVARNPDILNPRKNQIKVYAVPRGGVPAAYAIDAQLKGGAFFSFTNDPALADVIIDDLIDSGKTMQRFAKKVPGTPFLVLFDKRDPKCISHGRWVVFPWEETAEKGIEDNIVRLLQYCGEDVTRGGLAETPTRVAKAWKEWTSGYSKKPEDVIKVFDDGSEQCDEMVIVKDIPFYSHCEHHMAPFFGTATIAYIPNKGIIGLSKLSRLLDIFAKRLQVQERLTNQIADALMEHLKPLGCGVIINARHLCMESRGVGKQGHSTSTSALRGVVKDQPETRAEFISISRK